MILVIGGACQGKSQYVRQLLGYGPEDFTRQPASSQPVVCQLQDWVAQNPGQWPQALPLLLQKEVVLCNEVGCGVVPVAPELRVAREETGRLCIALAQAATQVVRLVCGIPTIIKE